MRCDKAVNYKLDTIYICKNIILTLRKECHATPLIITSNLFRLRRLDSKFIKKKKQIKPKK